MSVALCEQACDLDADRHATVLISLEAEGSSSGAGSQPYPPIAIGR